MAAQQFKNPQGSNEGQMHKWAQDLIATMRKGLNAATDLIGQVPIANGGTGQSTQGAAFDALAPTTTRGDVIARGAATNQRVGLPATGNQVLTNNNVDTVWANPIMPCAPGLMNGTLAEAHASNNVTYSVKTLAGADPSTADPVFIVFPNTTGGYTVRVITAALSVTLNSGSTLGVANATRFTAYICAFDDAGTVRLGVQQASQFIPGASGGIGLFGANQPFVHSSTAEGGGTATKSGNWYTGTAVTTKSFAVLGWAEYNSGLATAGTWNASPDTLMLWTPGVSLPGLAGEVWWRDSTAKPVSANLLNLNNVADQNGTLNIDTLKSGFVPIYAKALMLTYECGYTGAPAGAGAVAQLRLMADGYNLGAVLDRGKHQELIVNTVGALDVVAEHMLMPIHPARRQFFYALQSTDAATANKMSIIDCWGYTI